MEQLTPEQLAEATPEELAIYKQHLAYQLAKESPLDLMCWLSPETIRATHLEYLNDIIVAFIEYRLYKSGPGPAPSWFYRAKRRSKPIQVDNYTDFPPQLTEFWGEHPETGERVLLRLGIAMPPRHGKSFLVSEHLPLWYWMRHPDADIAFVTYSDDFATKKWGKKLRDKLQMHNKKLGLTLSNGARHGTDHLYFDETDGEMLLVGTGGGLTGNGYQLGIIDDPIKDAVAALSKATRDQVGEFYDSVFKKRKTRLRGMPIPLEIVMFTRWNDDDLSGRVIYNEDGSVKDDWYMLRLPAIAEDDDPLGREPGDALWPEIKNITELEKEQADGPMWFAAQFQQSPKLGSSGIFPTMLLYDRTVTEGAASGEYVYHLEPLYPENPVEIIRSEDAIRFATVDLAATKKTWSDYSVFATWDWHRGAQKLVLVDFVREKVASADHEAWLRRNYARTTGIKWVSIEEKTFGITLVQTMIRSGGMTVRPVPAEGDKMQRAIPYGQGCGNGQVFFPKAHPDLWMWLDEHDTFRGDGTGHDDMVDVGSYAWIETLRMPHYVAAERNIVDTSVEARVSRYQKRLDDNDKKRTRRRSLLSGMMGR